MALSQSISRLISKSKAGGKGLAAGRLANQRVVGRRKSKSRSAQIPKVRSYETVQREKRMARARYIDKKAIPQGPVGPHGEPPVVTVLGPLAPVRKYKRGLKAIKEIHYYQRHSDDLLLPKSAFLRVVRGIADENCQRDWRELPGNATTNTMDVGGFIGRFTRESILVLQMAAERYLVDTFAMTNMAALHRKAVTIKPGDMSLVKYFRNALALPDGKVGPHGPGF